MGSDFFNPIFCPLMLTICSCLLMTDSRTSPTEGSQQEQVKKLSGSKSPSSSRLILAKMFQMNLLACSLLSKQAMRMSSGSFFKSTPSSTMSPFFKCPFRYSRNSRLSGPLKLPRELPMHRNTFLPSLFSQTHLIPCSQRAVRTVILRSGQIFLMASTRVRLELWLISIGMYSKSYSSLRAFSIRNLTFSPSPAPRSTRLNFSFPMAARMSDPCCWIIYISDLARQQQGLLSPQVMILDPFSSQKQEWGRNFMGKLNPSMIFLKSDSKSSSSVGLQSLMNYAIIMIYQDIQTRIQMIKFMQKKMICQFILSESFEHLEIIAIRGEFFLKKDVDQNSFG